MKRLINRIGRRGAFLLFLAMLDFVYGYALLYPTPTALNSTAYQFLISILPLQVWGALWIAVGLLCLIYAFMKRDAVGYGAAVFLKILWATIFFLGWLFAGVERGYLSSVIWGSFAAILILIASWPERPQWMLK